MKAILICLVAFCLGYSEATVKKASAICMWNKITDHIEMTFTLDMNSEPQGFLKPIDHNDYLQTPTNYTRKENCVRSFTNSLYTVKSEVSYTNGLQQTVNPCEVVELTDPTDGKYYQWKFMQTTDDDEFIDELDRLMVVSCYIKDLISNVLTTEIVVLNPSLPQTVTPISLPVKFEVLVKNSAGSFIPASSGTAGDDTKLRLTLTRQNPFDEDVHPFGVYGYLTYAGPDSTFPIGVDTDLFVDSKGCPYTGVTGTGMGSNDRVPPSDMTNGYLGAPSANNFEYFSTTGTFMLPKYNRPQPIDKATQAEPRTTYFKTYFMPFYKDKEGLLDDPCSYLNGVTRKKRSSTEPEYRMAITSITVTDSEDLSPQSNISDAAGDNMVAITVGAVAGTTLVMIIAGIICLVAILRKERRRPKRPLDSRTSSTITIVTNEKK